MSDPALSSRVQAVRASPTLAISARTAQLRREGRDIASLSVGEPDFPVFPHVAEAMVAALRAGRTRYTPSAGTAELREAIAEWMWGEVGVRWPAAQVMASAGAKQALFNACAALLDTGDEAVIPNPYWVSYPDMVKLAGGVPVELRLRPEDGWVPRAEDLEACLTPRTRLVLLGSPSNPTGAVWGEESLRGLAAVLERHPRVAVLSDDIYGRLVYGGRRAPHLLQLAPGLADRVVAVNGVSKAYAMTGLRLGWACGPAPVLAAMGKVQDACTSNPSSLSQEGALAALRGPQEAVARMRDAFEGRRDRMMARLRTLPDVQAVTPDGAFYVFADVSRHLGRSLRGERLEGSVRLCVALLEEFGVAVVPGAAFGREGFVRLSFAAGQEELDRGLDRLERGLSALG